MHPAESSPAKHVSQLLHGLHGAAVLQGRQLRFGLFGALQSVGQLLGGVDFAGADRVSEGVAFAQLEVVEVARRDVESRFQLHVFVGEEPGVEAVEQDRLISGVSHQRFPGVVALPWCFDDDDPGAETGEVHATQDAFFVAFDIYFQKMDWPIRGVLFADRRQCTGLYGEATHVHALVFVLPGDRRIGCGQAGIGDGVERHFAGLVAGDALHGGIAGALLAEGVVVVLHRLDVHALPAVVIEGFGDRVVMWVVGTDIDIEALLDLLEGTPQADVFKILRIRNERHGRFLSV